MSESISADEYNALVAKAPSKYRNEKVEEDGYRFDSKAEHRYYRELKLRERVGDISQLAVHPKYPLVVAGVKICVYIADFSFIDSDGPAVVDVKGVKTSTYRLKKRLMLAVYGIDVKEVR